MDMATALVVGGVALVYLGAFLIGALNAQSRY